MSWMSNNRFKVARLFSYIIMLELALYLSSYIVIVERGKLPLFIENRQAFHYSDHDTNNTVFYYLYAPLYSTDYYVRDLIYISVDESLTMESHFKKR